MRTPVACTVTSPAASISALAATSASVFWLSVMTSTEAPRPMPPSEMAPTSRPLALLTSVVLLASTETSPPATTLPPRLAWVEEVLSVTLTAPATAPSRPPAPAPTAAPSHSWLVACTVTLPPAST